MDLVSDSYPWLLSNIPAASSVLHRRAVRSLLEHIVVLALFIPIVLALAESVSMQSATLTLQSLSDESLRPRHRAALWREARTAVLLGLSSAALVALVVLAWRRNVMGAMVVGGSIAASILGLPVRHLLPTLVRALKVDPRIAAGPLVLATTDVVTLVVYLGLGTMVLGG